MHNYEIYRRHFRQKSFIILFPDMTQEVAVPGIRFVTNLANVISEFQVNLVDVLLQRALPVEHLAAVATHVLVLHAQMVGQDVVVQSGTEKSVFIRAYVLAGILK